MTAVVDHAAAGRVDDTAPTLRRVVDALGPGVVRMLTAPLGLDVPAGEPVIHDPLGEATAQPHDLFLAVGVDPTQPSAADLVARCGELGACGVLLRTDGSVPSALVDVAETAEIALLTAPSGAAWGQLHMLLRSARSAGGQQLDGGGPLGDLFGLADAVSSLLGGAVMIQDAQGVVLADSSGEHPVDNHSRDTIGWPVPPDRLASLHEKRIVARLRSSDEVVRVVMDGAADRLAVGVRAGGELLGSIWVHTGRRRLATKAEPVLRGAASLAALHLLRARGADLERRRAGEQLEAVLDGRLPPRQLAEPLQLTPADPLVVLALELVDRSEQDAGVVVERAAEFVVMSCRALRRRVVAVASGRRVYAVLRGRVGGAAEARQFAADVAESVSGALEVPVRSCVVDEPRGLSALTAARAEADLGLRVLASHEAARQVHVDDVRSASVLLELGDLAAERPALLAGKVPLLQGIDRERSTSYVATLRAFLDGLGDVRAAADLVGVHPNTFRYRLRRLAELAELDLDDPVERLVVQLQLHLIDP